MNTDTVRNANLQDLMKILDNQKARRHDIVGSATILRARDGIIFVKGSETEMSLEGGVGSGDGRYVPTRHFDSQLATKVGIPPAFLAKLRVEAIDLYDSLVNGLLHGKQIRRATGVEVIREADARKFMIRAFSDGDGTGVARALLSDRFSPLDNFDVLLSALDGIREAGVAVEVQNADLTETRMRVRFHSPDVAALAPNLLGGYDNPFADPEVDAQRQHDNLDRWRRVAAREGMGHEPGKEPVVFAGFELSNSEVGSGAYTLTPRILFEICKNGLTLPLLATRSVHLGSKMSEGVIRWSDDTQRRELDLIKAKTVDSVKAFLSPAFLEEQVAAIEEKAGKKIEKPVETMKILAKSQNWSQDEADEIMGFFIRGGQSTAGGLVNALTAYTQTVPDADRADQLDAQAARVLDLV